MKVVLINPPQTFYSKSQSPSAGIPLGLLYIAGMLDRSLDQITVIDGMIEDTEERENDDGSLTIGLRPDQILERIKELSPDVVGITNPFTTQIKNACDIADLVKSYNRDIITIIGGPHSTVKPVEVLSECGSLDIATVGEGEYTFREIIESIRAGRDLYSVKGIAFRDQNSVILNESRPFIRDLDEIPFPAYDLIDMDSYFNSKLRSRASFHSREVSMITSRGCPYNCVFCSIHLHMGKKWRAHSGEYIVGHIKHLYEKYNVSHIHFEDDNLTFDRERFEFILDWIRDNNIKITWDTPNGVRADSLDLQLIEKMKDTGCQGLTIGVESGVQSTLDRIIHKKLDLQKVIEVAEHAKKLDMKLDAFFIIGFPGETLEDMQKTVDFALDLKEKYNVNMNLFIAAPFYGTDLYDECQANGYFTREVTPEALSQAVQYWGNGLIRTPEFTTEEVKAISDSAISRYSKMAVVDYMKDPGYMLRMAISNPRDALRFLKNLINYK